jgi:hypothetical protein
MNSDRKVDIIKTVTLLGFTISVFFHYILSNYAGLGYYPYNTFLFNSENKFSDFYDIYKATVGLNPYSSPVSVYFPFTFIVVYIFTLLQGRDFAFAVFMLIFIPYTVSYIYRNLATSDTLDKAVKTFIVTFMSYPFLFSIDRGNVEGLLFIFLALFIYFYQQGEDFKSVLFLSLAISMKLYPAVFLVLFLADKKYKNILITAIMVAAISLFSAAVLEGGVANSFLGLKNNLELFNKNYIIAHHGLQHNTSLYGVMKIMQMNIWASLQAFLNYYTIFAVTAFGLLVLFIIYKENVFWKRVVLLIFSLLLLPQVSFDYKLIHLFIPLTLFANCSQSSKFDLAYAVMLGLLLIPKDYYIISRDISIAVLLNPLIMLIATGMIITERYKYKI